MTKISLCITVKNESENIEDLLVTVMAQSRLPDEVVIVDGGSTDDTVKKVVMFRDAHFKKKKINWQIVSRPLNISQGRNMAIELATHNLIAITDAGCVLESSWLSELEQTYIHAKNKSEYEVVVAGFYQGDPRSSFEAAVVPYVLVMPDQVDPASFLPATRSMLVPKSVWKKVGGFDETLKVSEDFAFAHAVVRKYGQEVFIFCPTAVVKWRPRSNLTAFYNMIFNMAEGDIRAGIYRGKVKLLFGRYVGGLLLLLATLKSGNQTGWGILTLGFGVYIFWSILKNAKYVGKGWYWLPVLQLTADFAVLLGTVHGLNYDSPQK